jgi:hypothetical protein
MKIAPTLIMEPVDFFILPMWTLKDKLVLISKPKMKAEVEPFLFFGVVVFESPYKLNYL